MYLKLLYLSTSTGVLGPMPNVGAVLVLSTPIIKYIIEIHFSIYMPRSRQKRKENKEGLKTVQLSTAVVTML